MPKYIDGKVIPVDHRRADPRRYERLDLANAEPNLGAGNATGDALAYDPDAPGGRVWTPISGFTGSRGVTGPTGPQGTGGTTGPTGPTGPVGPGGADGIPGTGGPAGPPRPTGPAGAQGNPGPAGPAGAQGPAGPAGPAGAQGPTGPAGVVSITGSNATGNVLVNSGGSLATCAVVANPTGILTGVDFIATSDQRLKTIEGEVENALDMISRLRGVYYYWRDVERGAERQAGVIAQDVEQVLPEIVHRGDDGYLGVSYDRLAPVILQAIKELAAKISELEDDGA